MWVGLSLVVQLWGSIYTSNQALVTYGGFMSCLLVVEQIYGHTLDS